MNMRLMMLNTLAPVSRAIGKMHAPFTHKAVNGLDVFSIQQSLVPGAVLLTHIRGEMSNVFIPGDFTHAAIVTSNKFVIEATGDGVARKDIITFMTTKDRVVLLYPRFADFEQMSKAAQNAGELIGLPYDFLFTEGNKAFYCSELVTFCYEKVVPNIFTRRKRFGVSTVIPNDFIKAQDKWELVWDSNLA
jgi:uncharacterized protein YycO